NFGDPVVLYNRPNATWHAIFLASGCGSFNAGIGDWTSTDGGVTWAVGACVHNSSNDDRESGWSDMNPSSAFYGRMYVSFNNFASMFATYWRHMGWGEPAALNHVVHYVYAQHGAGADPGDVYYIRSTDSGVTFSAPLKLNTDATTTAQWQPNLSVNANGSLFV